MVHKTKSSLRLKSKLRENYANNDRNLRIKLKIIPPVTWVEYFLNEQIEK